MLVKTLAQETLEALKRGLVKEMPEEKIEALFNIHENIQRVWKEQVVDYLDQSSIYAADSPFIKKAKELARKYTE